MIDSFYKTIDKSNFYLGLVTQVYRDRVILQVENLSLLSHRELGKDSLIPNTINYYVVIDSIKGLFFGRIYQSKLVNSDNIYLAKKAKIWPEIGVDILGVLINEKQGFGLPGFLTAGIMDKVYIANHEVIKKYFESIEIKNDAIESREQLPCFSILAYNGQEIRFNPNTLLDKHLIIVGTTNSGKSTSALSILDKLIKQKIKVLIIDPTGEYQNSFGDTELKKLKLGEDTKVSIGDFSMQNWETLFEVNEGTQPAFLANAIKSLRYQAKIKDEDECYEKNGKTPGNVKKDLLKIKKQKSFNLSKLPEQLINESVSINKSNEYYIDNFKLNANEYLIEKIKYKLENTAFLNFFGINTNDRSAHQKKFLNLLDEIKKFSKKSHTSLYIDCSSIGITDSIGGTIIDLISNYLVNLEKEAVEPFVFFIDEVHRYAKNDSMGSTEFHSGLTVIAREGRKKGIFLFLTTQNPNDVDKVLLGQIGTLLIHRLTQSNEISAIQNHFNNQELTQIRKLSNGEAMLTSANLLTNVTLKIIKCINRNQDNETPNLITK